MTPSQSPSQAHPAVSLTHGIRETFLYFIFVWLLISFVRMFFVENFSVPTGSMTPTLVGGRVAYMDLDGDGALDYALVHDDRIQFLLRREDGYEPSFAGRRMTDEMRDYIRSQARVRYDNILVNKMAYWFTPPRRGDIAIFKPPRSIYKRETPVYVKRVVAEPGERVDFDPSGRLVINGELVEEPLFFRGQRYFPIPGVTSLQFPIQMGEGQYLFFGDNSLNSSDGRHWGATPGANVRGRVFFRYRPLAFAGFI